MMTSEVIRGCYSQGIWHSKSFGVPIRTPIQNSPEFWSEKLHGVPLQIAWLQPSLVKIAPCS